MRLAWFIALCLLIPSCGPGYHSILTHPDEAVQEPEPLPTPAPTECYCWEKPSFDL